MSEVMIPPWVLPETPETIRWLDDASIVFAPSFGRGFTQRGSWGDPRWGLRRRYRGLRSDQFAAIRSCLNESRGQLNRILVTPHMPMRGNFPTSELLTNNTFASGTTGYSSFSNASLAVSDRRLRVTRVVNTGGDAPGVSNTSGVTLTQYAPYVARVMINPGRVNVSQASFLTLGTAAGSSANGGLTTSTSHGLLTAAAVAISASTYFVAAGMDVLAGALAGDYVESPYLSLARCALVDNGVNAFLNSDALNSGNWTKTRTSVSADATAGPDGASLADSVIEDSSASNTHYVAQSVTVSSATGDYCLSAWLKAGARTWAALYFDDGTDAVTAYVNLATGALGAVSSSGANLTGQRSFVRDDGNGWYRVWLIARKTSSATTLNARVMMATGNGTNSYTGNGSSNLYAYRISMGQSGVPMREAQTTSTSLPSGQTQSGGALYLKGLPVSTNGLLEVDDWIEVAGQLKQITSRLNSDAAGIGYLRFRPALGDSPADNDPVIINQPFGRFIYSGQTKELENQFGLYGDIEMQLEEVYS